MMILCHFQFDRINGCRFVVSFFSVGLLCVVEKAAIAMQFHRRRFDVFSFCMLAREPRAKRLFFNGKHANRRARTALCSACLFPDRRLMPARDHLTQTQQRKTKHQGNNNIASRKKETNSNNHFDFNHNRKPQSTFLNVNCSVVGTLPKKTTKVTLVITHHNHQFVQVNCALGPSHV